MRTVSVRGYNDITPRGGVAWDVFGNGRTAIKFNYGKYLGQAALSGVFAAANPARRTVNRSHPDLSHAGHRRLPTP